MDEESSRHRPRKKRTYLYLTGGSFKKEYPNVFELVNLAVLEARKLAETCEKDHALTSVNLSVLTLESLGRRLCGDDDQEEFSNVSLRQGDEVSSGEGGMFRDDSSMETEKERH